MGGVPLPPLEDFFFLSSKMSLNRSSTTTLCLSFLMRLKRGSVLRRAKRGSDMAGGGEEDGRESQSGSRTKKFRREMGSGRERQSINIREWERGSARQQGTRVNGLHEWGARSCLATTPASSDIRRDGHRVLAVIYPPRPRPLSLLFPFLCPSGTPLRPLILTTHSLTMFPRFHSALGRRYTHFIG